MQEIVIIRGFFFWVPYDVLEIYFELKNWGKPNLYGYSYSVDKKDKLVQTFFRVNAEDYTYATDITIIDFGDSPSNKEIFENSFDVNEIERDDPDFVQAVKLAESEILKVVEIPDGVKWYIDQEDGAWESIHEDHRSWS